MDKLVKVINFIMDLSPTSQLVLAVGVIVVLLVVVIAGLATIVWFKIADIKHEYFAKIMEVAEDKLYQNFNISFDLIKKDIERVESNLQGSCLSCIHPIYSKEFQLSTIETLMEKVLIERQKLRIRTRFKKNHFRKLSTKRLEEEITLFSDRLYYKSMNDFKVLGLYKIPLLKGILRSNQFTIEDANKSGRELITEYIELDKLQAKAIKQIVFMPVTFWKWFKEND